MPDPGAPLTPPRPSSTTPTLTPGPFPSDRFALSPSKARAQARLTTQLSELSTWLDSLCAPGGLPAHLRGWQGEVLRALDGQGDTFIGADADADASGSESAVLGWLRAAKEENLRAGRLGVLLREAKREELGRLRAGEDWMAGEGALVGEVLDEVHAGLDRRAQSMLGEMAAGSVLLGGMQVSADEDVTTAFAQRIHDLAVRMGRTTLLVEELKGLEGDVKLQLAGLRRAVDDQSGEGQDEVEDDRIRAQTAQYVREAKQIRLKIAEYRDRISGLERQTKMVRMGNGLSGEDAVVDQVLDAQRRVAERRVRILELEQRLRAFGGLPPDLAASRHEVKRAQGQLEDLKKRREELFTSIGERDNHHG